MATNQQSNVADAPAQGPQQAQTVDASAPWDEERLENAMDVLQDLYIQVGSWSLFCEIALTLLVARSSNHCP